jgi:hypothetical protein
MGDGIMVRLGIGGQGFNYYISLGGLFYGAGRDNLP